MVFLEHAECFPNAKVEHFSNCFWPTVKEIAFLLIAGIKVLDVILNFAHSNKTTCFVLSSCRCQVSEKIR